MLLNQTNQQDDHMNDWLTDRLIKKKKPYLTSLKSGYLLGVLITDLSSLASFAGEFDLTKYLTFEYCTKLWYWITFTKISWFMYLISTENFYIANFVVPEIASLDITTLFQICAFLVF